MLFDSQLIYIAKPETPHHGRDARLASHTSNGSSDA